MARFVILGCDLPIPPVMSDYFFVLFYLFKYLFI